MAAGGITEVDYNKNKLFFSFLAGFAVEEHNKIESSSELEFVKVVNVRQQILEGTTYYITLEAKDEKDETDKKNTYEAEVWVTLYYSLRLMEFKQLLDAASSSA